MAAVTRVSSGCTDQEITFTPKIDDLASSTIYFLKRFDMQKNPDLHKKLTERTYLLSQRESTDPLSREELELFIQIRSLFATHHAGGVLNIPTGSQKALITFAPTVDDLNSRISHALLRLETSGGHPDLCTVLHNKVALLNTLKGTDLLSHEDIKFYLNVRVLFGKNRQVDDAIARHLIRTPQK